MIQLLLCTFLALVVVVAVAIAEYWRQEVRGLRHRAEDAEDQSAVLHARLDAVRGDRDALRDRLEMEKRLQALEATRRAV